MIAGSYQIANIRISLKLTKDLCMERFQFEERRVGVCELQAIFNPKNLWGSVGKLRYKRWLGICIQILQQESKWGFGHDYDCYWGQERMP
jgi:hypothetical protein